MLKIGAAQVVVPWSPGLLMAGYNRRVTAAVGQHQPLYARVLVASTSDSPPVCLVSLDTLAVDAPLTMQLRKALQDAYDLAPASVMVTATHTHAAPGGSIQFPLLHGSESFLGAYNPQHVDLLVRSVLQAVDLALNNLQPVSLFTGTASVTGVAANRRDVNGPVDVNSPFIRIETTSGIPLAFVYSFACHPTVLDSENLLYSGDLAGAVSANIARSLNCPVIPLTGAAGDISTRFTRRASTIAELERLAGPMSDALLNASTTPESDEVTASAQELIALPLRPVTDQTVLRETLANAEKRLQSNLSAGERRVAESEIEGIRIALAAEPRPSAHQTEVQTLRIGRSLITAFPAEMFVQYGRALTSRLPLAHLLIAGYANDYIGYVPTPDTAHGYELTVAVVSSGAGELLLRAAEATATACLSYG